MLGSCDERETGNRYYTEPQKLYINVTWNIFAWNNDESIPLSEVYWIINIIIIHFNYLGSYKDRFEW